MGKYLIVGGVAGGATTAARLRRIDEKSEIIMFERGDYISYANCGLPYYVGGTIKERDSLFVMTPEKFYARLAVDVRIKSEVTAIDRKNKEVTVKDLKTGKEYKERYDKLVLSPGAEPVRPPIPGIESNLIFTMRSVPDTDAIKNFVDTNKPQRAVIIGAGFIGIEMAENLHHRGIKVTIIEALDQMMGVLDYEMASEIHQHLKIKGVEFYLGDGVKNFNQLPKGLTVVLNSGKTISSDMVILSIGVRPETKLAKEAGIDCNERGFIHVDKYMQTNDPDIYALGDAVCFTSPITGKIVNTLLAGPANKQGRILADNIVFGNKREYKGAIATAVAKVFDLTVASTGMPEKIIQKENIPYLTNIIHAGSHAGYYPGALPMSLKLVFSPVDGRIYGAQAVGYEGVDKRIDVIAAIIGKNGTIYDLQEVEHCYAPPFSSAKDPVNQAGFAAENILRGLVKVITWKELFESDRSKLLLLDVRTPDEVEINRVNGALTIPVDDIRARLKEIPKDKKIVVFCAVGLRGYFACRILMQSGYTDVYNLSGGYKIYELATGKQSNEDVFTHDEYDIEGVVYENREKIDMSKTVEVDACGLQCPGPILRLKQEVDKLRVGEILEIKASDPGFMKDSQSWCNVTGNKLISINSDKGVITAVIQKGESLPSCKVSDNGGSENKTIIVFSNDFDKVLAAFVIANGAASMGKKVTMFFTFWGLVVLKKKKSGRVKKDFMGKMFGMMLPKYSKKLTLSKMNMGGMGTVMMRGRMKAKQVDSLETMINQALENGVKFIACQMSMDVMGVKKEELMDQVEIGGVASYLEEADKSSHNLFI